MIKEHAGLGVARGTLLPIYRLYAHATHGDRFRATVIGMPVGGQKWIYPVCRNFKKD